MFFFIQSKETEPGDLGLMSESPCVVHPGLMSQPRISGPVAQCSVLSLTEKVTSAFGSGKTNGREENIAETLG